MKVTFPYPLFLVLCAAACSSGHAELGQLANEKHRLNCEMEQLKSQADSLWNGMSAYLEQVLPTDMPAPERTNMVNTRNAYLLTQFRVYPSLDSAIQGKIRVAAQEDEELAEKMKAVMAQHEEAERKLNRTLEKLEGKPGFAALKNNLKGLEKQPCE